MRYTFVCVAAALTLPLHKRSLKAFDRSFVIRCKGIAISRTELETRSTLKGTVTLPSAAIPFELAAVS